MSENLFHNLQSRLNSIPLGKINPSHPANKNRKRGYLLPMNQREGLWRFINSENKIDFYYGKRKSISHKWADPEMNRIVKMDKYGWEFYSFIEEKYHYELESVCYIFHNDQNLFQEIFNKFLCQKTR